MIIYVLNNPFEILQHLPVGKSQNGKSKRIQVLISNLIFFLTFFCVMLTTIKFNNKFPCGTVKVDNVISFSYLNLKNNLVNNHQVV